MTVYEFIIQNNNIIIITAYSPDLAHSKFFLFPKIKMIIQDEHFGNVENTKRKTIKLLKDLSKNMHAILL